MNKDNQANTSKSTRADEETTLSEPLIDVAEEREDVYLKLKDSFNFFASTMADEKENIDKRFRATNGLSEIARILRLYLNDAEKVRELEKRVKTLEKRLT